MFTTTSNDAPDVSVNRLVKVGGVGAFQIDSHEVAPLAHAIRQASSQEGVLDKVDGKANDAISTKRKRDDMMLLYGLPVVMSVRRVGYVYDAILRITCCDVSEKGWLRI